MTAFLRHRLIEEEIKAELVARGYVRSSIRFQNLDLVAIERPGWVQVFNFQVTAIFQDSGLSDGDEDIVTGHFQDAHVDHLDALTDDEVWGEEDDEDEIHEHVLFGVVRDDQRYSQQIEIYHSRTARDEQTQFFSNGLLTGSRKPLGIVEKCLLTFFVCVVLTAIIGYCVLRSYGFDV